MSKPVNNIKEIADQPNGVNDILGDQIATAIHEYKRSNKSLFISALSAGLEIGFSIFLMGYYLPYFTVRFRMKSYMFLSPLPTP